MITVVRTTPGGLDALGNPAESSTSRHQIPGVLAPRTSDDVEGPGRSGVVVGLELFCPDPDADLQHTDQVEYTGELWDIDGDVGVWRSPYGDGADGLSCALKRGAG